MKSNNYSAWHGWLISHVHCSQDLKGGMEDVCCGRDTDGKNCGR